MVQSDCPTDGTARGELSSLGLSQVVTEVGDCPTDGAARGDLNLLRLSRVATEVDDNQPTEQREQS